MYSLNVQKIIVTGTVKKKIIIIRGTIKYFIISQSILSKAQWLKLVASTTLINRSGLVCADVILKLKEHTAA